MPLVRTTFRETPFEMSAEEAAGLRGQGLVAEILGEPAGDPPDPSDSPDGTEPDGTDKPKTTAKPAKETK